MDSNNHGRLGLPPERSDLQTFSTRPSKFPAAARAESVMHAARTEEPP
jgi:hypothetical protein